MNRLGVPSLEAYTDPTTPTCFGIYQRRTLNASGRRCSSYHAFLPGSLVRQRKNLTIVLGAHVQKILFSRDFDKLRATSILVEGEDKSKLYVIRAKHEIIISAGAIVTPQLLMLRYCTDFDYGLTIVVWAQKIIYRKLAKSAFMISQELVRHW